MKSPVGVLIISIWTLKACYSHLILSNTGVNEIHLGDYPDHLKQALKTADTQTLTKTVKETDEKLETPDDKFSADSYKSSSTTPDESSDESDSQLDDSIEETTRAEESSQSEEELSSESDETSEKTNSADDSSEESIESEETESTSVGSESSSEESSDYSEDDNSSEKFDEISPASYPNPRRDNNVYDTYPNNITIKDPYRWMENPESEETKLFVEQEMAITTNYLNKCPSRNEVKSRFTELYNFPKCYTPRKAGNRYYFFQNSGLQDQNVLYVSDSLTAKPKVFLDPNTFSKDGTVSLGMTYFSHDGQILAYTLSQKGSDWRTVQFKHVEKGDIYTEKLNNVKFSPISWTHDNKGIFYGGYFDQKEKADGSKNKAAKNYKLYYHLVGTEQSEDVLVAHFPDQPNFVIFSTVSNCGRYLILDVGTGADNNMIYVADLEVMNHKMNGTFKLIPVFTKMEAKYEYVANHDETFIFLTNRDANNFKLISVNITNTKLWKDLVPEDKHNTLDWASFVYHRYIVLCYIQDVKNVLLLFDITTGKIIKNFNLQIGAVTSFSGSWKNKEIFFHFTSFLTPGIIYHCDLSEPPFILKVFREMKVKNFDRNKFIIKQQFYPSKDGIKVPMYIIHKKDLQKNGNNPAFLYAYGGYGISLLPYFRVTRLLFLSNFNGVYAVANIRGGGEYGEQWHRAGRLDKKQNSFDDYQAAAEYLIAEKYTNSALLTANGASNGGLLMGVSLNQRPDLFGVVIPEVGVMDMLRYDKFTIGHAWIPEYGSPSDEKQFQNLLKYSPLHNIKIPDDPNKQYPATLLMTSDHDDRVSPLHSLKFIAALQFEAKNHPNQKKPLIIRIDKGAGHGFNKPTEKIVAAEVDKMCFIMMNTGIKFHS